MAKGLSTTINKHTQGQRQTIIARPRNWNETYRKSKRTIRRNDEKEEERTPEQIEILWRHSGIRPIQKGNDDEQE